MQSNVLSRLSATLKVSNVEYILMPLVIFVIVHKDV